MLGWGAARQSPTSLEPALLASGISHWKHQRFELYRVNPPLVRMIAALPTLVAGFEEDWSSFDDRSGKRPEFAVGRQFVKANGERTAFLFVIARWSCIPFSITGALVCFLWAGDLWNSSAAGLIALVCWCWSPNVLAHGGLVTNDVAAASMGLAAGYSFWRWYRRPTWKSAFVAGFVLGVAELTKMSWLILFVLWPLIVAARWCWRRERKDSPDDVSKPKDDRPGFRQVGIILVLAMYVVNLGYGFDGTCTQLKDFAFVSELLGGPNHSKNRFAGSWVERIPVPLPKQYILGFDAQRRDFEAYASPNFLAGEWKTGSGWWYYYLYGLLVKIPHGTQFLIVFAFVGILFRWPSLRRGLKHLFADLLIVLFPALVLFAIASHQDAINEHFRYVLPCFGFVFVFASGIWRVLEPKPIFRRIVVLGSLVATVSSTAMVYPHVLSYFNEASGGPRNGHRHMLGSSFDWGQDILFLARWQRTHGNDFVQIAHSLQYNPADLVASLELWERRRMQADWCAITANRAFRERPSPGVPRSSNAINLGYTIYLIRSSELEESIR
jgi:hypothetical protein